MIRAYSRHSTQSGQDKLLTKSCYIMTERELFKYWTYFKIIEKDFLNLSEAIEIDEAHFNVYSRDLIKLLVITCSEVDAVFRVLRNIDSSGSGDGNLNIGAHRRFVDEKHYFLFDQSIDISPFDISLKPFEGWTESEPPTWWTGYNKVKHHRNTDYKLANLGHCLNAGAALAILLLTAQTTISSYRLPMDPDIELEFFGYEYSYSTVVGHGKKSFNGK